MKQTVMTTSKNSKLNQKKIEIFYIHFTPKMQIINRKMETINKDENKINLYK